MSTDRNANFSSSSIYKLVKTGRGEAEFSAPGLTYIDEKRMEGRLGRALTTEHNARPTTWGTFVEGRVFDILPLNYKLESYTRLKHPKIKHWTGAPDLIDEVIVGDIKCPYTLKAFCQVVDSMTDVEALKKAVPEYYWQLVSNAILSDKDVAELIVYCPYQEELDAIRDMAQNFSGDQNKIAWINWAEDRDLPHLIKGKHYKNINIFRFDIPKEDKQFLEERVTLAVELLNSK